MEKDSARKVVGVTGFIFHTVLNNFYEVKTNFLLV